MPYPIDPLSQECLYIREQLEARVSQRVLAEKLGIPRTTLLKRIIRIREYDAKLKSDAFFEAESVASDYIDEDDIPALWERAMKAVRDRQHPTA